MPFINAFLGLAFVLLLLYATLKLVQKFGKPGSFKLSNSDKINITGVAYIDDSNKIICASMGPTKYLFVVGKNGGILLDKYDNYEK